jgi:hypothetical protein
MTPPRQGRRASGAARAAGGPGRGRAPAPDGPDRAPDAGELGIARRRRFAALARASVALLALAALATGCATRRIVPVPAANVQVDATHGIAAVAAEGIELAVRPSGWRGAPWELPGYVTPFHVRLVNGAAVPVTYDYASFRLFDDARFQYTALAPVDVERILRSRVDRRAWMAAAGPPPPLLWHRSLRRPYWDPWWWDRYYYDPWYYAPPPMEDIYLRALPAGALQPAARLEGFVYFPLLRAEARALTLEFHYWLGTAARVLVLPFGIERSDRGGVAAS